jgi:tetratricopeptide (TPR) repeat protein
MEIADQLDPLAPAIQMNFGRILYRARRFEDALRRLERAVELEPGIAGLGRNLGDLYDQMGLYEKALTALQGSDASGNPWRFVRVYALLGKRDEARRLLKKLAAMPPPPSAVVAAAHAALGDKDEAFRVLFAMRVGDGFNYVKVDPPLESLHSDPRWNELLRRMNLPVGQADTGVSR